MTGVLFVCLGNICRSPTAEAVFRDLLAIRNLDADVLVDSAGTADYHVGEPPCPQMRRVARRRGIDMDHLRARRVRPEDFERFDYIYAMDLANYNELLRMAPDEHRHKVRLFLEHAPELGSDVPDPYYGGVHQAERVFDIIEAGADAILQHLLEEAICP